MLSANLGSNLINRLSSSIFSAIQNTLPSLKILGDGSNNLILEKSFNDAPVTGKWVINNGINDTDAIELSITNNILQSDNVLSNTWTATGSKVQNGTVKSPMGGNDIPLLDLTQLGLLYQDISLPAGTYTQSFYYYATHQQILGVCVPDSTSTGGNRKYIDIIATNRWQKYSYTFTLTVTTTIRTLIEARNTNGVAQLFKPAISGLGAFMGFQIEAGSVARTRVATTTTSESRASSVANGACLGISPSDIGKTIKFVPNETIYKTAVKKYIAKFFIINLGQSKSFYAWKLNRLIHFLSPRLKAFGRGYGYYGTDSSGTGGQDNKQLLINKVIPFDNPSHWNEPLTPTIPSFPDPNAFDRFDCSYSSFGLSSFCDDIDLELLLFTENQGGTGFYYDAINNPNTWRYDGTGTLYNAMIARIDNYIAQFPDAKCIGIISDIQELDISANMTWTTFKSYLTGLYADLRSKSWALNNNIPIFHVPFSSTWTNNNASKPTYYAGLRALGSEVLNYYCVDTLAQSGGVNVYRSNGEIFGGSTPDFTHLSVEAGLKIATEINTFFKSFYPNNNITIPVIPPVNTVSPVVSGTGFITETINTTNGTFTGSIAIYTYQWKRNGTNISGATSNTYTVTSSDFSTSLTCTVTATNSGGSASATSNAISIIEQYNHDNFTDTNGIALSSHTGDYNSTWSIQTGTTGTPAEIQNNRLISRATTNIYRLNLSPPSANYEVYAKFICISELTGDSHGISGRAVGGGINTYYFARYSRASTSWGLFRMLASVSTQLGTNYTDNITINQTRDLILKMNGSSVSLWVNGVQAISVTDMAITGAGFGGIRGGANQSATTGLHIDFLNVRALT